jgi:pyrroline-5-carboxylate reductase
MSDRSVGFVGGGRVTRIFLEGWKRAQKMPSKVLVSDCNAEALGKLRMRFPEVETTTANGEAAVQEVVFVAVHPPVVAEVVAGMRGVLKPRALVVSVAPKFTVAKLRGLLGGFERLARVIPNAPSIVNFGFNPVVFGPALTAADKDEIMDLLRPLGECPEVTEAKLEPYAVLTGMGPTYLWFQLQTLREVAAGFDLTDAEIVPALKRMVCGGARTLLESGLTPAEVMDLIPVKPLAEMEPQVAEMYRTCLPALLEKIRP